MGLFNSINRGYGRSTSLGGFVDSGTDIISEVLEVEAVEDLIDGNIGGFVEDEFLAEIF